MDGDSKTMATALEQSFADVCEKHGLTCLGVNFHPTHLTQYAVYAHAGPGLLGTFSADTLAAALGGALAELQARRSPSIPLADEALPETVA